MYCIVKNIHIVCVLCIVHIVSSVRIVRIVLTLTTTRPHSIVKPACIQSPYRKNVSHINLTVIHTLPYNKNVPHNDPERIVGMPIPSTGR